MADKRILTNREWDVLGSCFAPQNFIRDNFRSVVLCDYACTSSSAGDWDGVIIQRFGNRVTATIFYQENNHPSRGFSVTTHDTPILVAQVPKEFKEYRELFSEIVRTMYN